MNVKLAIAFLFALVAAVMARELQQSPSVRTRVLAHL